MGYGILNHNNVTTQWNHYGNFSKNREHVFRLAKEAAQEAAQVRLRRPRTYANIFALRGLRAGQVKIEIGRSTCIF